MPAISTASLPDIVFMLLFFFMVTTVMRPTELKVKIKHLKLVVQIKEKSLVSYIYIGTLMINLNRASARIQLDDMVQAEDDVIKLLLLLIHNVQLCKRLTYLK